MVVFFLNSNVKWWVLVKIGQWGSQPWGGLLPPGNPVQFSYLIIFFFIWEFVQISLVLYSFCGCCTSPKWKSWYLAGFHISFQKHQICIIFVYSKIKYKKNVLKMVAGKEKTNTKHLKKEKHLTYLRFIYFTCSFSFCCHHV